MPSRQQQSQSRRFGCRLRRLLRIYHKSLPTLLEQPPTSFLDYVLRIETLPTESEICNALGNSSSVWFGRSHSRRETRIAIAVFARLAKTSPSFEVRRCATYALSFTFCRRAIPFLLSLSEDKSQPPEVRAQAAEGIANLGRDREECRRRWWRQAVQILTDNLDDPDPEVRLWSVFAIWRLGAVRLLPRLRELAEHDHELCPSMRYAVSEEARDAVHFFETGQPLEPDAYERSRNPSSQSD